jgi:ATP-binding cassette subfamily B protein
MYNVSPRLTLYTILHFLSYAIYKLRKLRGALFSQYLSKVSSFTQEIFSGIRVIKAYSLEDQHQNNMVNLAKESKRKSLNLAKYNLVRSPNVGSYR